MRLVTILLHSWTGELYQLSARLVKMFLASPPPVSSLQILHYRHVWIISGCQEHFSIINFKLPQWDFSAVEREHWQHTDTLKALSICVNSYRGAIGAQRLLCTAWHSRTAWVQHWSVCRRFWGKPLSQISEAQSTETEILKLIMVSRLPVFLNMQYIRIYIYTHTYILEY